MSELGSTIVPRARRGSGRLLAHLLTVASLGVALLALGAASGLAADRTMETSGSIGSYAWSPSSVEVNAGGTVEFKNPEGHGTHAVTWEVSSPETPSCTGNVPSVGTANWSGTCTFQQGGTYKFYCPVHPTEMKGTITVNGPVTPATTTGEATAISDTGGTLNGSVNPNGQATSYYFEYGTSTAYGTKTTEEAVGSGSSNVPKSVAVSSLSAATTYHFRIVAVYETNKMKMGADQTFTTTGPPAATTSPATSVGGKKATLAGSVNAHGHLTTYYFKYGATTAYDHETTHETTSTTSNPSKLVTGLAPETTYHFQLVAENASGTTMGADQQFTTFGKPIVTTGLATGITNAGATLGGSVNAQAQETTYRFNYGTTEAYGQETAPKSSGKGTTGVSVSAALAGLTPETTYHFRLVAENESGTTFGADQAFTTEGTPPPPPPPPPSEPSPPAGPPPPAAGAAPDTRITGKPPARTKDRTPTVKFKATVAGATYLCSVDRKPFKACRSPFTAPSLKPGRHRIRVKAVAGGVADPTPASCSFKVTAAKQRH
jgi:plastocyanin